MGSCPRLLFLFSHPIVLQLFNTRIGMFLPIIFHVVVASLCFMFDLIYMLAIEAFKIMMTILIVSGHSVNNTESYTDDS